MKKYNCGRLSPLFKICGAVLLACLLGFQILREAGASEQIKNATAVVTLLAMFGMLIDFVFWRIRGRCQ